MMKIPIMELNMKNMVQVQKRWQYFPVHGQVFRFFIPARKNQIIKGLNFSKKILLTGMVMLNCIDFIKHCSQFAKKTKHYRKAHLCCCYKLILPMYWRIYAGGSRIKYLC